MPEIKKSFNHFKLHTQYSICEGAIKIEDLEKFCKDKKINSIGICAASYSFLKQYQNQKHNQLLGLKLNLNTNI